MTRKYRSYNLIYNLAEVLHYVTGWSFFVTLRQQAHDALWIEWAKGVKANE